jgi:TolB protein
MTGMPKEILAGLFICSHDPEVVEQARIWDVHIDQSAGK